MAKSEKQRLKRKHKRRQNVVGKEWKTLRCLGCGRILFAQ